jgi:hypothetical protein
MDEPPGGITGGKVTKWHPIQETWDLSTDFFVDLWYSHLKAKEQRMNAAIGCKVMIAIGLTLGWCASARGEGPGRLDQRIGVFDFRHKTVAFAINALSRDRGVPIVVDWNSLGGERAGQETVNVAVGGCRLRDAIGAILPAAEVYEDENVVRVMGKEDGPAGVRGYAIGDLERRLGPGSGDEILRVIEECVEPDGWVDNGGKFGIGIQGSLLMAQQTIGGHEAIGRVLGMLKREIVEHSGALEGRLAPIPANAVLGRRISSLKLKNAPLENVLASLQAETHFGGIIRWHQLEAAGIDGATQVTADLSGLTLGQALQLVSEACGIDYIFHDGIVDVTTPELPGVGMETRVFDMRPMVDVMTRWESSARRREVKVNHAAVAAGIGELIQTEVDTDTWKNNGGSLGTISALGDCLVVTNRARANEQLAAMMMGIVAASEPATQPVPKKVERPDPLAAQVGEVVFDSTEMERAFDILSERSGARFFVDWRALESAGIDRDTPISFKVSAGPLRKALHIVLELAGDEQTLLGYETDDAGITHISTADRLGRVGVTRIYNIRDLIERYVDYHNVGGGNVEMRRQAARQDAVDLITRLIEDTVATDSWKDNGGSLGSLREFAGLLVVTTSNANQIKVKGLLETLRVQASVGETGRKF